MDRHQISPFPLRLDPDIKAWAASEAVKGDRSLNAQINRWLKRLKKQKEGANHE